jgi:hypothetical protein
MECTRFQTDGMRLLDGEMSDQEKAKYEAHVRDCDDCRRELKELGRVVGLTNELRLRTPDDEFWDDYWSSVYRRSERGIGFLLLMGGIIAVLLWGLVKALMSPQLLTYEGISIAVIIVGLIVVFVSVVRERLHESGNDPYKGVRR